MNVDLSNLSYGSHTLEYYAVDKLGNKSLATQIQFSKLKTFNVKNYGAKGDGITDDTLVVRTAIKDAQTWLNNNLVGQAFIYFPTGRYVIKELIYKPRLVLVGDGKASSIIVRYSINVTKDIPTKDLTLVDFADIRPTYSYQGIDHNNKTFNTRQLLGIHGYLRYQPDDITIILTDIKSMKFNSIRLNMMWESYRYHQLNNKLDVYFAKLEKLAEVADSLGIGIHYSVMHQWRISSALYWTVGTTGRGIGFPHECLASVPYQGGTVDLRGLAQDSTIDGSNDRRKEIERIFWDAFLNNYNCTLDTTKPIWEHIWDYYKDIVIRTKDHPSTLGYETINEPFLGTHYITTDFFKRWGNYNTYIANNLRKLTDKKIFIVESYPSSLDTEVETTHPELVGKSLEYKKAYLTAKYAIPKADNLVFQVHVYGKNGPTSKDIERIDSYKAFISDGLGIPIIVGEWTELEPTNGGVEPSVSLFNRYLQEFSKRGFGWFYFRYDPTESWSIKANQAGYPDRVLSDGTTIRDIFLQLLY